MRIADMNWMQLETLLKHEDRCVLPIGSTEQHAQLSLCVDLILSERVAAEAAEPLGVPVFPVLPYGHTPYFAAYPGSISLRVETLTALVRDVLNSLRRSGFRRIIIVNGHGGNAPAGSLAQEYMADYPEMSVKFHNWWNAPLTLAKAQEIDPLASHASWMENFPWTRLATAPAPDGQKPLVDLNQLRMCSPAAVRELIGDGNFGGDYEKPDEDMLALWQVGVEETRAVIEGPWPNLS